MPQGRYPGAVWDPGVNAGYAAGRTPVRSVVCHYTVGLNSAPIGRRGYFQFLVSRDGTVTQFAEADAVNWHAGSPWNAYGPGVEIEHLPSVDDAIFTPAAYSATALLCQWLHSEWGVPLTFHDGPRLAGYHGFITHRSLIQTGDAHSDYWPDLPRVTAPPSHQEHGCMHIIQNNPATGGDGKWYLATCNGLTEIPPVDAYNFALAGIPHSDQGSGPVIVALDAAIDRTKV
jgi:hypothetical protein